MKSIRNFENTLKHIVLKLLKPMGTFENTLKHIIWKQLKPIGNIWKHFETHHLKTIESYGDNWKHFETHSLKTIDSCMEIWKHFETHNLKTLWNLWGKHIWSVCSQTLGRRLTHRVKLFTDSVRLLVDILWWYNVFEFPKSKCSGRWEM